MESASPGHGKQKANTYQLILSTDCAAAALRSPCDELKMIPLGQILCKCMKRIILDLWQPGFKYGQHTDHMRKCFPQKRVVSVHQESNHWWNHQSTEWELWCLTLLKKNFIMVNESSKAGKPDGDVWGQDSRAQHSQGADTWNTEESEGRSTLTGQF